MEKSWTGIQTAAAFYIYGVACGSDAGGLALWEIGLHVAVALLVILAAQAIKKVRCIGKYKRTCSKKRQAVHTSL